MAPLAWLITGTTSGFGLEFVKSLLKRGDKVIATARDISKIAHFEDDGASILELDLCTDQESFLEIAVKIGRLRLTLALDRLFNRHEDQPEVRKHTSATIVAMI
jgi:NADP-dependent 3-hydroxy acid dehydrogenase YdfG